MHSPINNLIKMFFQYGVDMLANLSLASLAQCIKYKLLYDDFSIKYSNIPIFPHRKKTLEEEEKENIDTDDFFDDKEKKQITKKLKKSLIFTLKTPYLASSTMKMSNIDYMKNIALKNKIIKENNKEKEEEEDNEEDNEDNDDENENEEDKKMWIKIRIIRDMWKLSSAILFTNNGNDC
jgi:hypothetical protein